MIRCNLDLAKLDFDLDQTVIDENDRKGVENEFRRLLKAGDLPADGKVTWHDFPGWKMKPLNFLFYESQDVVGYGYFLDHMDFFVASIGEFRYLMNARNFGVDAWLLSWLTWEARQRNLPDPVPENGGVQFHDRIEYWGMWYQLPEESPVDSDRKPKPPLADTVFGVYEPHDPNEDRDVDLLIPNDLGSEWIRVGKPTELPAFPSHLEHLKK